jgi:hypothetical protein
MESFKAFIAKMNEKGVPLPLVRSDGKASLTASFAWISFNWAILSQIGKVTNIIGEVDTSAANYLFFGCLAAHLGRRMMGDGKKIEIDSKKEE